MDQAARGRLSIVATPLGNVDDLSPRAREALASADLVLAEDTRRAGLLFQRLGLKARRFMSFFEHNEEGRLAQVLAELEQGRHVALISDAGTPLLSDPGYRLVRACREQGHAVSPVPGPSAPVAALSACGLPPYPFTFLGFLPRREADVRKVLEEHGRTDVTLVFFERKSRLAATLALAAEALGDREFCVARELTKQHEEFIFGRLTRLADVQLDLLGELTVVVGPPLEAQHTPEIEMLAVLQEEAGRGGKPKDVARRTAERLRGWTVKAVYERARNARKDGEGN